MSGRRKQPDEGSAWARWRPRPWACTFSDGGAGGSLVMLEPDLLQGHQVLGEFAPAFEDRGVRPLETQTGDVL